LFLTSEGVIPRFKNIENNHSADSHPACTIVKDISMSYSSLCVKNNAGILTLFPFSDDDQEK